MMVESRKCKSALFAAFIILVLAPVAFPAVCAEKIISQKAGASGTCGANQWSTYNECDHKYELNTAYPGTCDLSTCTVNMCSCSSTFYSSSSACTMGCTGKCTPVSGGFECTACIDKNGRNCNPGDSVPTLGTSNKACSLFSNSPQDCMARGCGWSCYASGNIGTKCGTDTDCCSGKLDASSHLIASLRCYGGSCGRKRLQDMPGKPVISQGGRSSADCTGNCGINALPNADNEGRLLCYAAVWKVNGVEQQPAVLYPDPANYNTGNIRYDCGACAYPTQVQLKIIKFEATVPQNCVSWTNGYFPDVTSCENACSGRCIPGANVECRWFACTPLPMPKPSCIYIPPTGAPLIGSGILQEDMNDIGSDYSEAVTIGTQSAMTQGITVDQIYFAYALLAALFLLGMAYMATHVFGLAHLRPIIVDELGQLLITGLIAFCLVGVAAITDGYVADMLAGTGTASAQGTTMMSVAQGKLDGLEASCSLMLGGFAQQSQDLGREASRGVMCNFLGIGFSLVNCSPLNAYRGTYTLSAFATTTALADTYAQKFLLSLAANFAFSFLIPLGLFLRCFKLTRGAGGALIAIGFGFYVVYPTIIVATDSMMHPDQPFAATDPATHKQTWGNLPGVSKCDPAETDIDVSRDQFAAYGMLLSEFPLAQQMAYLVLVKVLFMSILNLIITLGFIRMFAHFMGSEIDVSALARIS